jgi:hypothetical protein
MKHLFDLPIVSDPGARTALTTPIGPTELATFSDGTQAYIAERFANYYRRRNAVWVQVNGAYELFV